MPIVTWSDFSQIKGIKFESPPKNGYNSIKIPKNEIDKALAHKKE